MSMNLSYSLFNCYEFILILLSLFVITLFIYLFYNKLDYSKSINIVYNSIHDFSTCYVIHYISSIIFYYQQLLKDIFVDYLAIYTKYYFISYIVSILLLLTIFI